MRTNPTNSRATIIQGVTYPSRKAAAEALGVTTQAIYQAARAGRLERFGMKWRDQHHRPVVIRGVEYETQAAAAEALGVTRQAVNMAARNGYLDRVGLSRC